MLAAVVVLIALIILLVIGVAHISRGFAQALRGIDGLLREFMMCYVASRENGTAPGQTCTIPMLMAVDDTPFVSNAHNMSMALTAGFDKCYDLTANATVTPLWPVAGCPMEEADSIWNSDDVTVALHPFDDIRDKHIQDFCNCKCSIFGKPHRG